MLGQALAHGRRVGRQVVFLQVAHHRRTGGHGHLVAAEGAGVGTGLPLVQPFAVDHHRQRQAAADGLGQHHHVGDDAGVLEGEHPAGTGEAALDLVDDQRHPGLLGDPPQAAQPVEIGRDHAALALDHLDDHRRRQLHAAFRIVQQVLQVVQVRLDPRLAAETERATVIVGIRQELHARAEHRAQRLLRSEIAHQPQRALAHAVVAALERQDGAAPGGGAYQFQRGFHRVGAGRAAELDLRLGGQRRRQQAEQVLDELVLHRGGQVEGVQRQLVGQNLADRLDHHWMVVPQRQGAGAGQAIDEGTPLDVLHQQPPGLLQCQRNPPRIAARVGLLAALPFQQGRLGEFVERFALRRGGAERLVFDDAGGDVHVFNPQGVVMFHWQRAILPPEATFADLMHRRRRRAARIYCVRASAANRRAAAPCPDRQLRPGHRRAGR
ncbi:hypothetical protein PAERUG_P6_East_of_England_6_IMP_1_03_09_02483 [Pseudomonas aeruginosa]|nr:hypothetical protein PAERUG_P18_London_17_VIM_2_04_10_03773 [Pseudomonas aeruginosa]CRW95492.1 hypothetical protein PAERUG_P6_East_of_England_6_IMP_1_03_09_02483 [Pseudomonas aeruginosa]